MELPKNITQIGEVRKDTKVYAEDYVVSYMKQLNSKSQDKETAVALYGRREEENGVLYYFLYGACRLTLVQREVRHLSQAQNQEIERLRRRYFPDYAFLGYRLLDGEMIEGFHIFEQEVCRYIPGYAQFYEKNDPMLNYMLEMRKDAQPERVDQEKYEEVKKRQEERRAACERQSERIPRERAVPKGKPAALKAVPVAEKIERMRFAAASVFVILCLAGFVMLQKNTDGKKTDNLQDTAKKWVNGVLEQQLPNDTNALPASGGVASQDVLVMEDKLEQALLNENQAAMEAVGAERGTEEEAGGEIPAETETSDIPESQETMADPAESQEVMADPAESQEVMPDPAESQEVVQVPEPKQEAVAYVVRMGDTLTAISMRQYGNDSRVSDICALNRIADPDDIKEGQVIMLPK